MESSFSESRFYFVIMLIAGTTGYPPAFILSYIFAIQITGFTISRGVNSFSIVLMFFIPLLFVVLISRYLLWICLRTWIRGNVAKNSFILFLKAHRSCVYTFPFTLLVSSVEMEGNAFGILILPILLIMCLIVGWKVQKELWRKSLS